MREYHSKYLAQSPTHSTSTHSLKSSDQEDGFYGLLGLFYGLLDSFSFLYLHMTNTVRKIAGIH